MKVLYIESKLRNLVLDISKEDIKKLPNKLILTYTIQFKDIVELLIDKLEKNKIKVDKVQQVLGCSKISNKENLPILMIGEGRFHLMNLYLQASEVYILENNHIIKISSEEIDSIRKKRKSALIKFLSGNNIGILVSTKPGQENFNKALKLKDDLIKKGKVPYIFLTDNIDIREFENFNIDSWVNTACIGMAYDNPNIINYEEIKEI